MTDERWAQLQHVNAEVNARVGYKTDLDLYGMPEFWEVADKAGDCEDYALAKRAELLGLRWPVEVLRLAVCQDEHGAGHAVLTVDLGGATYVLDNRSAFVEPWASLPYTWVKRQAAGGPGWVEVQG